MFPVLSSIFLAAALQAASPAPLPAERPVAFQGFEALALQGSVVPATGHPFFAVMVSSSGPTDRDGFNAQLKDPSNGSVVQTHAQRDFARWLATQGIGSLRFDKRILTKRDPKLNISLEAQTGDVRAALAQARQLPEAKGKKLLLVGFDEGALFSLLTAMEADAVLLIGMPPETLAKSTRAQIQAQLPVGIATTNLEYLDQVFDAIRKKQPQPLAGTHVHEAMVGLGKALMAPETLEFTQSMLDLDPWLLTSRLNVPSALVWGDRDIQTLRPAKTPDTFRGTVIDIAQANHLLKREERPRTGLSALAAVQKYGDATPFADLSPIAAWLHKLAE
jgi:hypothetical protein